MPSRQPPSRPLAPHWRGALIDLGLTGLSLLQSLPLHDLLSSGRQLHRQWRRMHACRAHAASPPPSPALRQQLADCPLSVRSFFRLVVPFHRQTITVPCVVVTARAVVVCLESPGCLLRSGVHTGGWPPPTPDQLEQHTRAVAHFLTRHGYQGPVIGVWITAGEQPRAAHRVHCRLDDLPRWLQALRPASPARTPGWANRLLVALDAARQQPPGPFAGVRRWQAKRTGHYGWLLQFQAPPLPRYWMQDQVSPDERLQPASVWARQAVSQILARQARSTPHNPPTQEDNP